MSFHERNARHVVLMADATARARLVLWLEPSPTPAAAMLARHPIRKQSPFLEAVQAVSQRLCESVTLGKTTKMRDHGS